MKMNWCCSSPPPGGRSHANTHSVHGFAHMWEVHIRSSGGGTVKAQVACSHGFAGDFDAGKRRKDLLWFGENLWSRCYRGALPERASCALWAGRVGAGGACICWDIWLCIWVGLWLWIISQLWLWMRKWCSWIIQLGRSLSWWIQVEIG